MTPPHYSLRKGVTLLELTVVISMILTLLSTLFISATYYRDGATRATCVAQITQIQKGVRSYQNLEGLNPGTPVSTADFIGPGKPMDTPSTCPRDNKAYQYYGVIPPEGVAFAKCTTFGPGTGTDAEDTHHPGDLTAW